jgi:hypothetical protein
MHRHVPYLTALAVAGAAAAFHVGMAQAAEQTAAKSIYAQERADCETGRTQQDRATCLKEAGAAAEERKRNGLANPGSVRQNAVERCKALPPKDKVDCLARIEGPTSAQQQVITSGSVGGGGVIRETRTTTAAPAASAAAPSEPASAPR